MLPASLAPCCALQIQPDLWQKLCFKNLTKRIISAQTQCRYGQYTRTRSALSCLCFARCCRSLQVDGTWWSPLPTQRVLGARGRPGGQSCRLAWTCIVPLAGTWPMRNIYCEYHCAALVCSQEKKNRRRTRNPVLCFESSSVVAFPLQQTPKGDEMSICLCFPVIFWNGLHWSVHSSFVSGFLFCYSMCSKSLSLPLLPVLFFFLFFFLLWCEHKLL